MQKSYPIGVFDSGYGGLTILQELMKEMPEYDFYYLGDNARSPYGTRSFRVVYEYTLQAVTRLFDMGCRLVILACNTASAKALRSIQQNDLAKIDPNRRVLGIIRPSVEEVDKLSRSKNIGILATNGTVVSESYPLEIKKLFPHIRVWQEACPMWVPLVENGEYDKPGADYFIEKNIKSLLSKSDNIDAIILACTHYPLLMSKIREYVPKDISIISQGKIVAESLKDYLKRHPEMDEKCSKNHARKFFTTEQAEVFIDKANIFCNSINNVEHINL